MQIRRKYVCFIFYVHICGRTVLTKVLNGKLLNDGRKMFVDRWVTTHRGRHIEEDSLIFIFTKVK